MIGWIALGITALLFAAVAWRVDDWSRDWTQNTASLDPDSDRPELRPLELPIGMDEVVARIESFCQENPTWNLESVDRPDEKSLSAALTRTTPLFRFVDDVDLNVQESSKNDGVTVFATSRSRVGKGDLGQNPRNLIELTGHLAHPE